MHRGSECNTLNLLGLGWQGLWLERSEDCVSLVKQRLARFIAAGRLRVDQQTVTAENVDALLSAGALSPEPDLLSIDIDSNDYWVWQALESIRPRVVTIEYNATWRPPLAVTMKYDPAVEVRSTDANTGASLSALQKLGDRKGYRLVGCCFTGVNAFFVRENLCRDLFRDPFTAENHYEPLRPFMLYNSRGRTVANAELQEV